MVEQITQDLNSNTDMLARFMSAQEIELTRLIPIEFLVEPSITKSK